MTLAPAAVAKSISIAAESERDVNDEELEKELNKVSELIANLPKAKGPLPKEERRYRENLSMQKAALEKIKEARENRSIDAEVYNSMIYSLLTSWWGKHPYLMHLLVNIRLKSFRYMMF